MTRIGYHASHEQFAPSELLQLVQLAEQAGFECAKSSDHFQPWSERQGHSGFAWSWLGAALQATRFGFGNIAAPGYRYHPAVLAQAAATLGEMFPGRFWLALGSGEAINEAITGLPWPEKAERNARLRECFEVMRALLAGETVTHRGRITVIEAKLWSRPDRPVPLYAAAVTPQTAKFVAPWADGLLTTGGKADDVRKVLEAFREHGGEGKPVILQAALCWAPTDDEAIALAMQQWSSRVVAGEAAWDLRRPADFDATGKLVDEQTMREALPISADLGRHIAWIQDLLALGPVELHLHQVGRNQREFIETFGTRVLPALSQADQRELTREIPATGAGI
ncbi:MAG: TIGR03885 family FMN-dependent LLM class oxidoreductase [Devosia sp.]